MKTTLRALLVVAITGLSSQALAGEPYVCKLSHFNSQTKVFETQETELIMDRYNAVLETDAGDVKMKVWRSWSRSLGLGIVTSKKIHMQFSANGEKSVEKSAREGDVLKSNLKNQWSVSCSPLFPVFPGRVSPEIQKYHDEHMD